MDDRIRTGDRLDHNQELYQLSYAHRAGFNLARQGGNYLLADQLDGVEVAMEEVLGHEAR